MSAAMTIGNPTKSPESIPPTELELGQMRFRHACAQRRRLPKPLDRFKEQNPLDILKKHRPHLDDLRGVRDRNGVLYVANYAQFLEVAFVWWFKALGLEVQRLQEAGPRFKRNDETGRLEEAGDLTWSREPVLPKIQVTTDRELGVNKFDNGAHQSWLNPETQLAVLWVEPGGKRNEGITGAVIDLINLAVRLDVPLWIVFDVRHPYGPKHAHHDERIDEWVNEAKLIELAEKPSIGLPTKAKK